MVSLYRSIRFSPPAKYVYILPATNHILCGSCGQDTRQTFYKIGFSDNPQNRRSGIETGCPLILGDMRIHESHNARDLEEVLKEDFRLKYHHIKGEWFMRNDMGIVTYNADFSDL